MLKERLIKNRKALLKGFGILFIFIIILSGVFVIALPSEELTKTYDSATQTVSLKDDANNEVAEIQLLSEAHKVVFGKEDYAAEIKINSPSELSNFISNMEFYEDDKNGNLIEGSFSYKYYNPIGTSEKIVNDYEKQCEIAVNGNGTEICSNVLIGSHNETITGIWENLDIANIPSGETKIRMYWNGNLASGEIIEWVPTFSGIKVEEWASFEGAVKLEFLYTPDQSSATPSTANRVGQTFTIGRTGGSGSFQSIGVSIRIENASAVVSGFRVSIYNVSGNFPDKEQIFNNTIEGGSLPNSFDWFSVTLPTNFTFENNTKYAVVLFVESFGSVSWRHSSIAADYPYGNAVYTNYPNPDTWDYLSSIDMLFEIWGTPLTPPDSAPSIPILNSPADGANISSISVTFNYSAEDDNEIANTTLFIDGVENTTTIVGGVNSTNIATEITGLSEGVHNWYVIASDNIGQTNTSETRTFSVDTIAPSVVYGAETEINGSSFINHNIVVDIISSDSGSGVKNITIWLFDDNNYLIGVDSSSGSSFLKNFTGLEKGDYYFNATVSDFVGNENNTETRSVRILNSVPTQTNPLLTTSTGKNFSTEDLTCNNQSTSDADNDEITNIVAWYKNGKTFSSLYLPFEINTNDYSGNGNDGINNGAVLSDGKVGNAVGFDGIDDFINLSRPANIVNLDRNLTVEAWVYSDNNTGQHLIFDNCELFATRGYCLLVLNNEFRFHVDGGGAARAIAGGINEGQWYHVVGTYDNSNIKIYVDGALQNTTALAGPATKSVEEEVAIGHNSPAGTNKFDGKIDELRVYNASLTAEQISNNFNLNYNKIVNQETAGGQDWMCQVTPNDGEADGETLNSANNLTVLNNITFNVTFGEDGSQESNFNIDCTNGLSVSGVSSPYETGFDEGTFSCVFTKLDRYDKTIIVVASADKTVDVTLSREFSLTVEEHTWLEAIYNCINGGDCALYNILLQVNDTVGNIWEHTAPTDEEVVNEEDVTNRVVNSTANLTIDYNVSIPIKAGYALGTYLPVRIGFWFLNQDNSTCYNQGDKPTGVEGPYCQPLITEVLGPMGSSVSFSVELQPDLPTGDYSIKRIIDIDPNNVWINYGQEVIGTFKVTEALSDSGISSEINAGSSDSEDSTNLAVSDSQTAGSAETVGSEENEIIKLENAKITGAVAGNSIVGSLGTIMLTILTTTFAVFLILLTILANRTKKKFG